MRLPTPDKKLLRVLLMLAITQVIAWGTVGLPAIVGRSIAADLALNISVVFAGTSVLYVVMGLLAPWLATAFTRFGARLVMIVGAGIAGLGFVVMSFANGPVLYFGAWVILGVAGSASLTTAAYIMLNEVAGRNAKSAISALMLVTGLSSSIFWPTTSLLANSLGWRGTCLVFAALMVLVCLPLHVFGLPRRVTSADAGPTRTDGAPAAMVGRSTFYLLVGAIALNAFVTFGFAAIFIELLQAQGLSQPDAVAFGSVLGVIAVGARAFDFVGGGRWDSITTALIAGFALPVSMLLLMLGSGTAWTIGGFILLYGLGSGALAVARATMPLVFYDKAEFTRAMSRIALPLNLVSAAAPPILVGVLTQFGSNALLGLAMACSGVAFVILLLLRQRRPVAVVEAVTA